MRLHALLSGVFATLALHAPIPGFAQQPGGLRVASDALACPMPDDSAAAARDSMPRDTGAAQSLAQRAVGPAIILRASANAREVRFNSQPRLRVRLCGGVADSVRVVERRNLPEPVQPGVTYRDVYIAIEILGHLHADCIVKAIQGQRGDLCAGIGARDTTASGSRRSPP